MHRRLSMDAVLLAACLLAGVAGAQIPSTQERMLKSSLNPDYRRTWRALYLRLPKPANDSARACYRHDVNLSAAPRRAALTLYARYPGAFRFAINGQTVSGPRSDRLQNDRFDVDVTEYLRAGRNVLTYEAEASWLALEGIVFCEDGSTVRLLTGGYPDSGWRGGWDQPEGWDDPAQDASDLPEIEGAKTTEKRMVGSPDILVPLPYYGPIQVKAMAPDGRVLNRPIVDEESPLRLQVHLLNLQAGPRPTLDVDIMDEFSRQIIDRRTVELSPDGALDLAGQLERAPLPQGAYRVRFVLARNGEQIDRRDVEVASVGRIKQREVQGSHYEDGMDLKQVWQVDCTAQPGEDEFIAGVAGRGRAGAWEDVETVVEQGPAGSYRTFAENRKMSFFAYRYKVRRLFVPHLVVIEWPDDARRSMIAHVVEPSTMFPEGRSYQRHKGHGYQRGEASVICKDDLHPERGNRMQKLHILYWPNEEEASVHICNVAGEAPAAAARITVYEITNDLPALKVTSPGDRLIGPHTERGVNTMSSIYYSGPLGAFFRARLRSRMHPEYYRNWYTVGENFIKRLRFSGQNLYLMGHFAYEGTLYPVDGPYRRYTQDDVGGGNVIGDYTDLLLRMFEKNGIAMVSAVEHFGSPLFWKDQPTADEVREGASTILTVSREGEFVPLHGFQKNPAPNYLHPFVQEQVLSIVDDLAGLYGDYPSWKGIAFVLSSAVWGPMAPKQFWDVRADPLDCGYEDWTVARFEKDTGVSIPVEETDPDRFEKRYQWLMAHTREAWVDWRADRFTALYRDMRDRLVKAGPDLTLYLCTFEPGMGKMSKAARDLEGHYDEPAVVKDLLKTYGFDVEALKQEPGMVVSYAYCMAGSGTSGGHPGWREVQRNQAFQNVFANDNRGGAWIWGGIPHYGAYSFPEGKWLFTRNATRQGFFYSTYVTESFVNVMARSNPTWMPHAWADVSETVGRLHEKRLFARAYRSLPNGTYERLHGNGFDRNLWLSRCADGDTEYLYAANLHWWPTDVTLRFEDGVEVHDLIKDEPVRLEGGEWTFRLAPYSLQTFRVRAGATAVGAGRANPVKAVEAGPRMSDTEREEAESVVEREASVTSGLVRDAAQRATKEPGIRNRPGWRAMPYLERCLETLAGLRKAGRFGDAFAMAAGGGLTSARDLLADEALQAMPFLIAGPFGKPDDTDFATFGVGNPEVTKEWRGMETPYIGESAEPVGATLQEGFRPDPSTTYRVYGGQEVGWEKALKTRNLSFPPFESTEALRERLLELQALSPHPAPHLTRYMLPKAWMVAYATTEVYSPREREACISVGSPQAIWVWVNGRRVIQHGGHGTPRGGQRPTRPRQNTGTTQLRQGWNTVLIKVGVRGCGVDIFFSLSDPAGQPLTDLRYRVPERA